MSQRPQRQNLPEALACVGEEVYKLVGGGTQISDAPGRWERYGMEQQAGGARKRHAQTFVVLKSRHVGVASFVNLMMNARIKFDSGVILGERRYSPSTPPGR